MLDLFLSLPVVAALFAVAAMRGGAWTRFISVVMVGLIVWLCVWIGYDAWTRELGVPSSRR